MILNSFLDWSCYKYEAIKMLLDFMKGYKSMLDECKSFSILKSLLEVCTTYEISELVPCIAAKMEQLVTTIDVDNMIDAMEAADKIDELNDYKSVAKGLHFSCMNLARKGLVSVDLLQNFICKLKDRIPEGLKLIKILKEESKATFSFDVSLEQLNVGSVSSSIFIVNNLPWRIEISKNAINKRSRTQALYTKLFCPKQNSGYWSSRVSANMSLLDPHGVNNSTGYEDMHNYTAIRDYTSPKILAGVKDADKKAKDNQITVVATLNVLRQTGEYCYPIKKLSDLTDADQPKFKDLLPSFKTENDECNKAAVKVEEDEHILVLCGDSVVAVKMSILTEESSVIRTKLSKTWTRTSVVEDSNTSPSGEVMRARTLTLPEGYDPKAAEILFGYLKGFNVLLEHIEDFKLLEDILGLCAFYMITSPLEAILKHMQKMSV